MLTDFDRHQLNKARLLRLHELLPILKGSAVAIDQHQDLIIHAFSPMQVDWLIDRINDLMKCSTLVGVQHIALYFQRERIWTTKEIESELDSNFFGEPTMQATATPSVNGAAQSSLDDQIEKVRAAIAPTVEDNIDQLIEELTIAETTRQLESPAISARVDATVKRTIEAVRSILTGRMPQVEIPAVEASEPAESIAPIAPEAEAAPEAETAKAPVKKAAAKSRSGKSARRLKKFRAFDRANSRTKAIERFLNANYPSEQERAAMLQAFAALPEQIEDAASEPERAITFILRTQAGNPTPVMRQNFIQAAKTMLPVPASL
jgi:hypothetical protein